MVLKWHQKTSTNVWTEKPAKFWFKIFNLNFYNFRFNLEQSKSKDLYDRLQQKPKKLVFNRKIKKIMYFEDKLNWKKQEKRRIKRYMKYSVALSQLETFFISLTYMWNWTENNVKQIKKNLIGFCLSPYEKSECAWL